MKPQRRSLSRRLSQILRDQQLTLSVTAEGMQQVLPTTRSLHDRSVAVSQLSSAIDVGLIGMATDRPHSFRRPMTFTSMGMAKATMDRTATPAPPLLTTIMACEAEQARRQPSNGTSRLGARLRQLFRSVPATTTINTHTQDDDEDDDEDEEAKMEETQLANQLSSDTTDQVLKENNKKVDSPEIIDGHRYSRSRSNSQVRWHLPGSVRCAIRPRWGSRRQTTRQQLIAGETTRSPSPDPTQFPQPFDKQSGILKANQRPVSQFSSEQFDDNKNSTVRRRSRPQSLRTDVRTIFMDPFSNTTTPLWICSCCIQTEDKEWLIQMEPFDILFFYLISTCLNRCIFLTCNHYPK
ncbi:hypothetical protein BDF19DRAFT_422009 [Syncephalis fuscata]|nr:hypothetical protein BDF19DRAFT_422009 [Syncephalis fuscata]